MNNEIEMLMPIKATPYEHQKNAFAFVCDKFGVFTDNLKSRGTALLMEMGTGKTIVSIAVVGCMYQQEKIERVLVVAPLSILGVWQEEFEKFADFPYSMTVLKGTSAKKKEQLKKLPHTSLQVVVVNYGAADSDYALRLYYKFTAWFDRFLPKHGRIVSEIESPTAVYLGIMKYNGVPMNLSLMSERKTEAEKEMTRIREQISFLIGDIDIGANCGTKAFKDYLFDSLHLPVLKNTATNREAADDQTMQLLSEWCAENKPDLVPLFSLVQEYRKWGKIMSTYIDGYLKYRNTATDRLHPDFFALSTDTGRMNCRNPNAQNMPRKTNDPVGVRNFIKAPDGCLILSLDYSQVELRIGAFYCRDLVMQKTYRENGDIHAATTSVIFGVPYETAIDKNAPNYKEHRTIAKNVNFGTFYGLFPNGLQKTLKFKAGIDLTTAQCAQIIDRIKDGYLDLSAHYDVSVSEMLGKKTEPPKEKSEATEKPPETEVKKK